MIPIAFTETKPTEKTLFDLLENHHIYTFKEFKRQLIRHYNYQVISGKKLENLIKNKGLHESY